jgi:hypothetical protein
MIELSPPSEEAGRVVEMRAWTPEVIAGTGPSTSWSEVTRSRFTVIDVDDINLGDDPIWMIEGLLPASGFGVVFGPPKSGKSFLLSDALFHVALGRPWAGRSVQQGAVIYITGEGVTGFKRRLVAMRRHYGVEGQGVAFGLITVAPDFGHKSEDAQELKSMIRDWLSRHGNPSLAAIALDTLARAMKGADENTAKDMTTFVDNCGLLGEAFGCLVVGVHHAGKDTSRGSRGSNALDGAVDVMWSVEKGDGFSTAAIHHMKDGEGGLDWQFRLSPYVLQEATETRGAVSTCVVEIVRNPAPVNLSETPRNRKLPMMAARLMAIIKEAVSESGRAVLGDPVVPFDQPAITREILKRYAVARGWVDTERRPDSIRAQFNTNLNTLAERKLVGLTREHIWLLERV